ncbi:MAG TPA: PQQ-binding-like beta-propeller repeat protein, partial [Ktedonobacteraceae bacterium]|nr:PQQ-binding-like beta-propeller repeat protein [Ktedonobacteraceae bacterium]
MKETPPEYSDDPAPEPAHPRCTLRAFALKLGIPILIICVVLGGFFVLITHRQPAAHGLTGGSRHANATPSSVPPTTPDSVNYAGIQKVDIVQSTLYETDDAHYLYAMNMRNGATTRYHFDRMAPSFSMDHTTFYVILDNNVVAGKMGSDVQAWHLGAGAPSLLWSHHQQDCCTPGAIAVANGVVYTFAGGGIGAISALRASNGTLLWNYPTNGPAGMFLTVANGVLYAGMDGSRSGVSALNATTGKLLWNFQQFGQVLSAPVVVNGIVYSGASDRTLSAFNGGTGALLWRYVVDYAIITPPVVSNGVIYVGTADNSVFALRANNGSLLWHQRVDKLFSPFPNVPGRFFGVFVGAVNNGMVYVGSEDGYMCALRASDGSLLWHRQFAGLVISPFAIANNLIYISSQGTNGGQSPIYALQASDGSLVWRAPANVPAPTTSSAQTKIPRGNGMIPLTRSGTPAFTVADVKQYFKTHPILTTAGKPGTLVKVAFMASKQAST